MEKIPSHTERERENIMCMGNPKGLFYKTMQWGFKYNSIEKRL
jgi:hypothetical protein